MNSLSALTYLCLCVCLFFASSSHASYARGEHGSSMARTRRLSHKKSPEQDNVDFPPGVPYPTSPVRSPTGVVPSTNPPPTPPPVPAHGLSVNNATILPSIHLPTIPSTSPSFHHSTVLTALKEPTNIPSTLPTRELSSSPSLSKSGGPSLLLDDLTVTQSNSPSTSPSNTPTYSYSPRSFPSDKPSGLSRLSSSILPSSIASGAPTFSFVPTVACSTDADGIYGSSDTNSSVIVTFNYELEVSGGIVSADVIRDLERQLAASVLPTFFADQCSETPGSGGEFGSDIAGISASPRDIILELVCSQKGESNTCNVLNGALTVFLTDTRFEGAVAETVLEILEEGMANDDFLDANNAIERVTFVYIDPTYANPGELATGDPNSSDESGGRNFPLIFGIVGGLATLLLILGAFVWRKQQQDEDETTAGGGSAS